MKQLAVLDAPSNLGLRMPAPGVVPGCYKLAGAVRDQRFLERIGALDAGYLVPPRSRGLNHAELVELLRPLLADELCVGFHLTIFDPDLDPDGSLAAALTDTAVAAFADRTNR